MLSSSYKRMKIRWSFPLYTMKDIIFYSNYGEKHFLDTLQKVNNIILTYPPCHLV